MTIVTMQALHKRMWTVEWNAIIHKQPLLCVIVSERRFVVVKQQSHVGEEYVDSWTLAGITAFCVNLQCFEVTDSGLCIAQM